MTPETHDAAFAAVSHLPHMLAFALMNSITEQNDGRDYLALAGPGFRDFSRIAASDPNLWRDVLLSNREEIARQSELFERSMAQLRRAIGDGDGEELKRLINNASHARANWRLTRDTR